MALQWDEAAISRSASFVSLGDQPEQPPARFRNAKKDDPPEPQVFINPEILWASEEKATYEEGCLSIPEFYEEVERPAKVRVKFFDVTGAEQELEASGLLATCLQHEIDHLDGVLFIDHISKLKRDRVIKKFAKAAKRGETE